MGKYLLMACLLLAISFPATAQERHTISGHIHDAATGESLIGVACQIVELRTGGITNNYGFYSVTIPAGTYTVRYSLIGYTLVTDTLTVDHDITRDVDLEIEPVTLEEITVQAQSESRNVSSTDMGTMVVKPGEISNVPVLFGEQDILKTMQLLPGISETGEGFSGFFVRGGDPGQNLVLLDEAPVYHASHLLGFFSVFNSDALSNVKLIKGAAPPEYGGRLSSFMDIRMHEGNNKSFHTNGGLGLIFSRLTLQGPIVKDRGSFLLSGRRTYADIFLKLSSDEDLNKSRLYFYDLNLKANYRVGDNDRLYLSGYFGRDVLGYADEFGLDWGNATATLRWNHLFSDRLFLNSSLIYSNFNYVMTAGGSGSDIDVTSGIEDVNLKEDFQYYLDARHTIRFGVNTIRHRFVPGKLTASEGSNINDYRIPNKHAYESAAYIAHEYRPWERLTLDYGLRLSLFNVVGPGDVYTFDDDGGIVETNHYGDLETIESYGAIEPRVLSTFLLDSEQSVKLSFARNRQYIHLLSNSSSGTPFDIWQPSTNNVKPEYADQTSAGYFRNFHDNEYETSLEIYYKDLKGQVDYKDGADIMLNKYVESELVYGKGWAYGAEYLLRKNTGKLTGWISYTLGKTERKYRQINEGKPYPLRYDRTHDLALVGTYRHSDRWTFSSSFVFHTGDAVTFPSGKYDIDGMAVNYYTERNGYRMPVYHRMDFGVEWTFRKRENSRHSLNFSLYNVYGRDNAYTIYFRENEDNPAYTEAVKVTLFTFVPSITYNFSY